MPSNKLSGQIKVAIKQYPYGLVTLAPVSERVRRLVAESNAYDGSCEAVFQSTKQFLEVRESLPRRAVYRGWDGYPEPNDGAVIMVDSWTFRHMVGGQSD